jgi:hypothetical protein
LNRTSCGVYSGGGSGRYLACSSGSSGAPATRGASSGSSLSATLLAAMLRAISSRAALITRGLLLFSHLTSSSIRSNSFARSRAAASSL